MSKIAAGTEVSVLHEGRRQRGWIAENEEEMIVRLYPKEGGEDYEINHPRQVKVLKRQNPPRGWNAVDLLKAEDQRVWISLRFDDRFWESLVRRAELQDKTLEEMVHFYIIQGLESASGQTT